MYVVENSNFQAQKNNKEKTMFTIEVNEDGEQIETKYRVPLSAIKEYLETDSEEKVEKFLREQYISDDTENIIDICNRNNLDYYLVNQQIAGQWVL